MAAAGKSFREKMLQLDPLGTIIFLPSIICLLIALQWGGSTYAWSSGRIIALLTVFAVLLVTFCVLQVVRPVDRVTIPIHILKNRSMIGGMWYALFGGATMVTFVLFIPVWFQAIKGVDAVQSGIRTIPLMLGMVIFVIASGAGVQRVGYYAPFMIAGSVIMPIGAGMLSTWTVDASAGQWIGYQVLLGVGMGLGLQQPNIAAQTVLSRKDASTGVALMIFWQSLGGAIFSSVAQNILDNKLISNTAALNIPGFDPASVVSAGATNLRKAVPAEYFAPFLVAYNDALTKAMTVGVATASLTIIGALLMEWKSTKTSKQPASKKTDAERSASVEQEHSEQPKTEQ